MKHIFTIHSHITFLASLSVIQAEGIPEEQIVFICSSNYIPPFKNSNSFKWKVVKDVRNSVAETTMLGRLKLFSLSINSIKFIDRITEKDDYIAYIDIMSAFNKLLVFHSSCTKFNIIEEGIVNYGDYYDFNLLTADLRSFSWSWSNYRQINELWKSLVRLLRGHSLRMQSLPIHPNIYSNFAGVKSFCFSDLAFPNVKSNQKVIIKMDGIGEKIGFDNEYPDGSWFWIGDALSKQYGVHMVDFKHAAQELMKNIPLFGVKRKIHVKFRGSESIEEQKITIRVLEKAGFEIEYIDKEVIMELIFAAGKDFKVCGIASSLLIYANHFGHETFSMFSWLPDQYNISLNQSFPRLAQTIYSKPSL
jgi:hypothetical protein